MADIICRWRNGTPKTVVELVNSMPHEVLTSERFRNIMSTKWDGDFFRTPYQLACQLGLYYESEEGYFFPRFDHDITTEEAEIYLFHWLPRYYIPNPYISKNGFNNIECPTFFLRTLYEYVREHPNCDYHDACLACFKEEAKNNDDIIRNYINNYSRILTFSPQGKLNVTDINPLTVFTTMDRTDRKSFFDIFNNNIENIMHPIDESLQQIYYGAPGTGKLFAINRFCAQYENYRTTFHPDTDYAAFVGSYKPITVRVPVYGIQGTKLRDEEGKTILEDRIVYRYIFQSFLKAYIAAWREQQNEEPKPVFLIIEEINRGNCAQIFGDIFQLLDRNEAGFSDYPILADDDLAQELKRVLGDFKIVNAENINALYKGGKDVVAQVKLGSHLLLPNNLYIWATMNTSDQSLFPIDSAFKRRWDWKYIKIKDAKKGYRITFSNGHQYDWWQFVSAINAEIECGEIQQEDKKLGYFFAKACDGKISAETFVSKVLFYLYNDVFKDFGLEEAFFKDENGKTMTFASYFDEVGEINEERIEHFVTNLDLIPKTSEESDDANEEDDMSPNGKRLKYSVNGNGSYGIGEAFLEMSKAIARQPNMTLQKMVDAGKAICGKDIFLPVASLSEWKQEHVNDSKRDRRFFENEPIITAGDNIEFVVSTQWGKQRLNKIQEFATSFGMKFEQIAE